MSFNKTMLSLALESGEVAQPESFDLPPRTDSEETGDYLELLSNGADEINRGFETVTALESLALKYENQELTESSLENYRTEVAMVFAISGSDAPVSVMVPSFESASGDKTTIGQKSKKVIDALIKWLRERWEALKTRFKQLVSKLNLRKTKADVQHKSFKEKISNSDDEEVKCGYVPDRFVKDGVLQHELFIKFIHNASGPAVKEALSFDMKGEIDFVKLGDAFSQWHQRIADREVTRSYTTTKGHAELVEEALYNEASNAKFIADAFQKNVTTGKTFTENLNKLEVEGPPTQQQIKERNDLQILLRRYSAQMMLATKFADELFKMHDNFTKNLAGAEQKEWKDSDK
jgi:hypothetical protein